MPTRLLALAALLAAAPALAAPTDWHESAQTALHLLDYVGVDYPEFVRDGQVLDQGEYEEQLEFATQVVTLLRALPERPERARLVADAESLVGLVRDKGPGPRVAAASADLRWALIGAYGLVVAPKRTPDLARGQALYLQSCANCHGVEGRGDGPAGHGLDPAPASFTDAARMTQRSVHGLYNTITLGVDGTGMASWTQLSDEDRWALAFYVSRLSFTPEQLARGEAAWESGAYAATFPDLRNVATLSHDEIEARYGATAAAAQRWLRAHPDALDSGAASPIERTVASLRESLEARRSGDSEAARRLALAAYLEGFELIEPRLDRVDGALRTEIEREMMAYRSQLGAGGSVPEAEAQVDTIVALLGRAEAKLEHEGLTAGALFTSSLVILLREGLEAILVLAAIIAFLVKSERRDALPWVHLGWAAALLAGAGTWFVATYVTTISGASREMTEAVSALFAAAVLLYVGVWLHSKANAAAWQKFVREQVGGALGRRTLWALASVAFLAVYRELFEIVLFYQALWAQAGGVGAHALVAGAGAAAGLLALVAWGVFQYGVHLPIGRFFTITSIVLGVLAVAFVGQGISALQEAGAVGVDAIHFIRVPALGIFPTAQTLAAQLAGALVLLVAFTWASRQRDASEKQIDGR